MELNISGTRHYRNERFTKMPIAGIAAKVAKVTCFSDDHHLTLFLIADYFPLNNGLLFATSGDMLQLLVARVHEFGNGLGFVNNVGCTIKGENTLV